MTSPAVKPSSAPKALRYVRSRCKKANAKVGQPYGHHQRVQQLRLAVCVQLDCTTRKCADKTKRHRYISGRHSYAQLRTKKNTAGSSIHPAHKEAPTQPHTYTHTHAQHRPSSVHQKQPSSSVIYIGCRSRIPRPVALKSRTLNATTEVGHDKGSPERGTAARRASK